MRKDSEIFTESMDRGTKILSIKKSLHDLLSTINPEDTSKKSRVQMLTAN